MLGRPVDLEAPSGTLGSSDAMGYVETWEEVQDVDFGGGLTLPLRFGFSSNPGRTSSFFGKGWMIPLWDARAAMVNETSMRVELLCGKVLYLHCKPEDPTNFATLNGSWKGTLDQNGDLSVFRDDGWLLKYHQGHLVELKTDQGRDIVWEYDGDQFVSLDERGGASALSVTRDVAGQATGLVVNGQSYSFTLGRRPMLAVVKGTPVIAELDPSLASFTWPDGKSDTFKFSATPSLIGTLDVTDAGGQKSNYTWDPQGHILSDNDWRYSVGGIVPKSNLPALSRTNAQGQSEEVSISTQTGVVTETSLQGVTTTTLLFRTPGPYFNKVREITETANGVTRVLERRSYDETGRLIRSMDESGTITAFTYDSAGQLVHQATTLDPKVFAQLQQQEAGMLKAIAAATDPGSKSNLQQQLGNFYIFQMKDYEKAVQLAVTLPDPGVAYRVSLQAIFYNDNLSNEQKIAEYKKLLPLLPQCAGGLNDQIATLQKDLVQK